MRTYLWLFCLLIISCSENPESYIEHLDGYWEIQEVTLDDGSKKEYKYNETIDYISLNDSLVGFRKKLKPGINGTYLATDHSESLKVKVENGSLNIYYQTPYAKWKETVLDATSESLKIINENKAVYLYKRYTPITIDVN
jgi:hypothetical protein